MKLPVEPGEKYAVIALDAAAEFREVANLRAGAYALPRATLEAFEEDFARSVLIGRRAPGTIARNSSGTARVHGGATARSPGGRPRTAGGPRRAP